MGYRNFNAAIFIKRGEIMQKFLYALVVILLFIMGLIGLFYGFVYTLATFSLYYWWVVAYQSLWRLKSSI